MIGLSDCQRTKCGAKNFSMTPIYALLQNYHFSSVEDQSITFPMLAAIDVMDCGFGSAKPPKSLSKMPLNWHRNPLPWMIPMPGTHGPLSHLYSIQGGHDKGIAEGLCVVALDPGGVNVQALPGTSNLKLPY